MLVKFLRNHGVTEGTTEDKSQGHWGQDKTVYQNGESLKVFFILVTL